MYTLGNMYQSGIGVPKDAKKGFDWFRKAADAGHTKAMVAIGICYERGLGVKANEKKSINWILKAAQQGDPEALYIAGYKHYTGQGLSKDPVKAYQLLYMAALRGYRDAYSLMQVVTNDLKPEQVKAAEAQIKQWQAEAATEAAEDPLKAAPKPQP